MRLNRMIKDRQEILVLGELVLFLAAWSLGLAAAIDDYRIRTNRNADNNMAANQDLSSSEAADPRASDEWGVFE